LIVKKETVDLKQTRVVAKIDNDMLAPDLLEESPGSIRSACRHHRLT
jgi:hypothetical protein